MKKKIDNNNLLPYFTDHHEDLPADYLKSCEKFFKEIKEKQEGEKHDSIKEKRL
tara:strand:- start:265 stop:426 length:162 start_codon:yes stop_codon:yes gene_type:complete